MDGYSVPSKSLELDFKGNNYIRAYYHRLFSSFNHDTGIYLKREDFVNGHTLYSFDLSPDMCDGTHLNLQHQGNLRIEIKLADSLIKLRLY